MKICVFCNCWLHCGYCAETHLQGHVKGTLCRGFRRRAASKAERERLGASQLSEPGLVTAAGAVSCDTENSDAFSAAASNLFEGYDQSAEEATELMPDGGTLVAVLSAK